MNIKNASWILINSMVDRELTSSKYNQRVSECHEGLDAVNKALKKTLLINELTLKDLESIKQEGIIDRRLYHIVSENMRVLSMKEALEKGDIQGAGDLLNDSHYKIFKANLNDRIVAKIQELDQKSKVNEIARLLSNEEITSDSIKQATNMMGQ